MGSDWGRVVVIAWVLADRVSMSGGLVTDRTKIGADSFLQHNVWLWLLLLLSCSNTSSHAAGSSLTNPSFIIWKSEWRFMTSRINLFGLKFIFQVSPHTSLGSKLLTLMTLFNAWPCTNKAISAQAAFISTLFALSSTAHAAAPHLTCSWSWTHLCVLSYLAA